MPIITLAEVFTRTKEFIKSDTQIVMTTGLATFGLASLLSSMFVPAISMDSDISTIDARHLMLVPVIALFLTGYLLLSYLTLVRNVTVSDGLRHSMQRLPTAVMSMILMVLMIFCAALVLSLVMIVIAQFSTDDIARSVITLTIIFLLIWLSIRLFFLWPIIVERNIGAAMAVRQAILMTKGSFAPLAGLMGIGMIVQIIVILLVQMVVGSTLVMIGTAIGAKAIGLDLAMVVTSMAAGLVTTIWTVFVAQLYKSYRDAMTGI